MESGCISKRQDMDRKSAIGRRWAGLRRDYEQTLPFLRNYTNETIPELQKRGMTFEDDAVVYVRNLMAGDDLLKTEIVEITASGFKNKITKIKCPCCGKELEINKYWECYICCCQENGKQIYDVIKLQIT